MIDASEACDTLMRAGFRQIFVDDIATMLMLGRRAS